ncbi:MAG: hypothetical protein V7L23_09490 [Nostoc sp.]|uniref:hypothetical protein n=1 Tax=Nostoc sp. TaxID=1180 RepID=UPI002FEF2909
MARIECPNCNHLFEAQRDASGRCIGGTAAGAFGAGVGAGIGEGIGIALLGTAIAGTLPVAIIGGAALGLLGWAIGNNFDNVKCPECQHEFKPPE